METRSRRRLGKKSLPGDRQGVPGADAGHDSMQTIGGYDLSRRDITGRPETTTAETIALQEQQHINHTTPSEDALQDQPATTKDGKQRQRMKWTDEMNIMVMRCYYTATKLETIESGYRHEFRRLFLTHYTHLEARITEQRLIDQKRVIIKNNRLPPQELQRIKESVAIELNNYETQNMNNTANEKQDTIASQHQSQPTQSTDIQQERHTTTERHTAQHESRHEIRAPQPISRDNTQHEIHPTIATNTLQQRTSQQIQDKQRIEQTDKHHIKPAEIQTTLDTNIIIWSGTDPTKRNRIPRLIYKKDTPKIINIINEALTQYMDDNTTLQQIHTVIYAAAITTIQCNRQKIPENKQNSKYKYIKPHWKIRLERKIETLRKDIGRLTQATRGNTSRNITKHTEIIINRYNNYTISQILDTLKQKLSAYAARLKRYNESNHRKEENRLFTHNEKLFYQKLNLKPKPDTKQPTKEQITQFWTKTWSTATKHNSSATWIIDEEQKHSHIAEQPEYQITEEELTQAIRNTHNWKCPGVDQIHNYWYKQFTNTHPYLTQRINRTIENPHELPTFLTEGTTYIKPKNQQTEDPANYRPITCLPTLYKIITGTICRKIEKHLTQHNIIAEEQKGCKRNSQGCKEQLIIDSTIMKQATKQQRNLHTCYIDYKKAFDSIPHTWLKYILQIYKINRQIRQFLYTIMQTWRTKIHLKTATDTIQTDEIKINKGIFQGDALSALWFNMCLNPLSNLLNHTKYGFNIRHQKQNQYTLSHLIYMDDIKLYAATKTQLEGMLKTTEKFTTDIGMEFGIRKCKTTHIEKGHWTTDNTQRTLQNETLENLDKCETYKYLGFEQNTRINHTDIKQHLQELYRARLIKILRTKLNSKNLTKAINTYAISILTYSFGIINWTTTDLENIDRITRTQMTKFRKLHPKSCKERITIGRSEGGRGQTDIQSLHNRQIQKLRHYFHNNEHQLHKAIVQADKNYTPLNLRTRTQTTDNYNDKENTQMKMDTWARKQLHGKHYYITRNENISTTDTYKWLQKGTIFPETEGFLMAIQDQVIATRNYTKHILKDSYIQDDRCRKCKQAPETIDHITGGCKLLASTEYTERHNMAAKIIHKEIANRYNLEQSKTPYYKYIPTTIIENKTHKLYWDVTIHTDKTMKYNRPDITLVDKKEKITYLIDISVPNDTNLANKYNNKIEKYQPLAQEIQRIWNQQKVYIIPIIISATGITPHSFKRHLHQLKLEPSIHEEIQKAVILKTCNITRNFLNIT